MCSTSQVIGPSVVASGISIEAGTTVTSVQTDHSPDAAASSLNGFTEFSFDNSAPERPTMLLFSSGTSFTTMQAVRSPNGFSSFTVTQMSSPGLPPNFITNAEMNTHHDTMTEDDYHMQIAHSFASALSSGGSTITTFQAVVSPTGSASSTFTQLRTPTNSQTSLHLLLPPTNESSFHNNEDESLVFSFPQSESIAGPRRLSALALPPSQQPPKKGLGRSSAKKGPDGALTDSSAAVRADTDAVDVSAASCGESPLPSSQQPERRGPGRPPGSKNKKTAGGQKRKSAEDQSMSVAKRRSTNLELEDLSIPVLTRGRGRPRKIGKAIQFKPTKSFATKNVQLQNEGKLNEGQASSNLTYLSFSFQFF